MGRGASEGAKWRAAFRAAVEITAHPQVGRADDPLPGEKTGELPNVLGRLSTYMEEDLKTAIKTATQFIEPVMIGVMGILIGGVAIAMLMPIMTISKVMAQ